MMMNQQLKRWWVPAIAAVVIGLATAFAGTASWGAGFVLTLVTFCAFYGLDRALLALRDRQVPAVESVLLWALASGAWYAFWLAFPALMLGRPAQWVPEPYVWVGPVVFAIYAVLYRLRRQRGVNPEW